MSVAVSKLLFDTKQSNNQKQSKSGSQSRLSHLPFIALTRFGFLVPTLQKHVWLYRINTSAFFAAILAAMCYSIYCLLEND